MRNTKTSTCVSAFQRYAPGTTAVDFTQRKLLKMSLEHRDKNVRLMAAKMLEDYLSCNIAVAWEDGCVPVYMFIDRKP